MAKQDPALWGEWSHATWDGTPVAVTVASTQNRSTQLKLGIYRFISTVACYVKQGTSAVEATAAMNDSVYVPAGTPTPVRVTDATANGYVSVIRASSDGTSQLAPTIGAG